MKLLWDDRCSDLKVFGAFPGLGKGPLSSPLPFCCQHSACLQGHLRPKPRAENGTWESETWKKWMKAQRPCAAEWQRPGSRSWGGCPAGRPGMGGHLGRPEHRPAGAARRENWDLGPHDQEAESEDGREDSNCKRILFVLQKPPFQGSFYQLKGKQCLHTALVCAHLDSPRAQITHFAVCLRNPS